MLVLAIVAGVWRYAHVSALRHDGISPPLLGMSKVCGDDSVRRALVPHFPANPRQKWAVLLIPDR